MGIQAPGGFGSKDPISTIKELREVLAVKEAWKKTADIPTLRAYKVKANGLRVRDGSIGPQTDNGVFMPGGGHQYEVIDNLYDKNWQRHLEVREVLLKTKYVRTIKLDDDMLLLDAINDINSELYKFIMVK